MEALSVGERLVLDVRPGLTALDALDKTTFDRFFTGIEAEVVGAPTAATGTLAFRHAMDVGGMVQAGAWAPWTCFTRNRFDGGGGVLTEIRADRVRPRARAETGTTR